VCGAQVECDVLDSCLLFTACALQTNRQLASCVSRQQQQQQQQAPLPALVLLQPPQQTTSSSWTQAWLRAWRHC
jgi:hypothetical protein